MLLYRILENGYYGGCYQVPDDPDDVNGIPLGTTKKAVPDDIPEGLYPFWGGSGWNLTNIPPTPPPPPEEIPQ
jgi:hypothetical protein